MSKYAEGRCQDCGAPVDMNPKTGRYHKLCKHCYQNGINNKSEKFVPSVCPNCGNTKGLVEFAVNKWRCNGCYIGSISYRGCGYKWNAVTGKQIK